MIDPEGGKRVKRLVLAAMGSRHIPSIVQLSERSGVGRDTLNAWFRGREPGPDAGAKVAEALGLSYRDLMDVYRGAPQATQTPDDLVVAINRQSAALEALVAKFDGEWDHRLRKVEDALDALVEREWLVTRELAAPDVTAGSKRARA